MKKLKKENVIRIPLLSLVFLTLFTTFNLTNNKIKDDNNCLKESEASESYDYEKASIEMLSVAIVNSSMNTNSDDKKVNYKNIYAKTELRIREQPSIESEVVEVVGFNTKLKGYKINDDWYEINYKNKKCYVSAKHISKKKMKYKSYRIPNNPSYSGIKTWMPYTAITCKSSKQYKLQQKCTTGKYGIRVYDNRYCVAIGSHFNCIIGQYFDLVLKNGEVIKCIMGDAKADIHTDSSNIFTYHSICCSEFVVDKSALIRSAKRSGNMSSACDEWDSKVVEIRVYEKFVDL